MIIIKTVASRFIHLFKTEYAWAPLLVVVGVLFIFSIPPLWGYDETAHFSRSYQISEGGWIAEDLGDGTFGGYLPANYVDFEDLSVQDRKSVQKLGGVTGIRYVDDNKLYTETIDTNFSNEKKWTKFPGAAAYSPIAYAPSSVAIFIANILNLSIRDTILFARLVLFSVFVVLAIFSYKVLGESRAKYLVLGILFLPSTIFQAVTIGTDALVIGLSLLLFSFFIKALQNKRQLSEKFYIFMLIAAVFLPLVKINYIFISLLILLIKPSLFRDKVKNPWLNRIAIGAIVTLPVLAWNYLVMDVASGITQKAGVDTGAQIVNVLSDPFDFIIVLARSLISSEYVYSTGIIGRAGWGGIVFPLIVLFGSVAMLTITTILSKPDRILKKYEKYNLLLLFLIGILTTIGIFFTLYATFTPVDKQVIDGVHGRYLIPLVPLILYPLARMLPFTIKIKDDYRLVLFLTIFNGLIFSYAIVWYRFTIY